METDIKIISSVERNKAASRVCKRLFPSWVKPPTQGELQRIICEAEQFDASEREIFQAGCWWLWVRELAIENTFSKQMQIAMMKMAVKAAVGVTPINFVSCRSPELLHAQVFEQGEPSLPRSQKAISKLKEIVTVSQKFLPTLLTLIFADLAIDNLTEIEKRCDIERTIRENLERIAKITQEERIKDFTLLRMSKLKTPDGRTLGEVISPDGSLKIAVALNQKAEQLIKITARESFQSHQRMFGWTEEQSFVHNRKLGITMGFVGQATKQLSSAILIHNEAFIARGALNNLFTDPEDPLPVICLRDLLEAKKRKED